MTSANLKSARPSPPPFGHSWNFSDAHARSASRGRKGGRGGKGSLQDPPCSPNSARMHCGVSSPVAATVRTTAATRNTRSRSLPRLRPTTRAAPGSAMAWRGCTGAVHLTDNPAVAPYQPAPSSYNHEEAIACFQKAIGADPDCAMAWWVRRRTREARAGAVNSPPAGDRLLRLFDVQLEPRAGMRLRCDPGGAEAEGGQVAAREGPD